MSTGLENLISELYGDYRIKNKDVVKFEKFVKERNMDRYALFDDIKQNNYEDDDDFKAAGNINNNSSETVKWLISNNCYDTIYPLIIEFMSQYLTDPKREEMLEFLTQFLESFTSQSRYKQSIGYLKKFQSVLCKLFDHQKQFIKNMNDNRLTLNLRYHDEYNQFRPLLTILIDKIYESFNSNHYIHSFEYLNIFQLFLENGANPLYKASNGSLTFKTMHYGSSITQILDVLYGLYPMIIQLKQSHDQNEQIENDNIEELVINKYLSLLRYGKISDSDDMESWFPTLLTVKRNLYNNNTNISFVNDAFLSPYSYKYNAHQTEQQQCIRSIYTLKRLLIRGFNIIDIQNDGIINALISKSEIIRNICYNVGYINNAILRGKIILLLWIMRILIIEIRDEFICQFHKIYNETYDEFKEECGGTAISYTVWIMIMDYGIVNKLTFLNKIDDGYFVQNAGWRSLHSLSPDIIIFIFNNILNNLSENQLKIVVHQIDRRSFMEIFKMVLFQNNDKKYDNTIIMKMCQYLLVDNNYNDTFLIKQLFDIDLMEKIFWNKDNKYNINNKMLAIYSDTMYKYYQHNYQNAKTDIPINTKILNQYLFLTNYSDSILEEKIKVFYPQKLMQLCSIQILKWIFKETIWYSSKQHILRKLKFVLHHQWLHVLVLILNERLNHNDDTNYITSTRILQKIDDDQMLHLLLSYLNNNVKEFKNEDNYKEIKQQLYSFYFNVQKRSVKYGDIITEYMRTLQ